MSKVIWLDDAAAQALMDNGHTLIPVDRGDPRAPGGLWKEACAGGFGELNALIDAIGIQADRMKARIAELEAENAELRRAAQ